MAPSYSMLDLSKQLTVPGGIKDRVQLKKRIPMEVFFKQSENSVDRMASCRI